MDTYSCDASLSGKKLADVGFDDTKDSRKFVSILVLCSRVLFLYLCSANYNVGGPPALNYPGFPKKDELLYLRESFLEDTYRAMPFLK